MTKIITTTGATAQVFGYVGDRSVNVKIVPGASAIYGRLTFADFEEVYQELLKILPWLQKENLFLLKPTGEYGSTMGFIFEIPTDQELPTQFPMH